LRNLTRLLFRLFLSPGGLFLLATLDSTLFFWFPFGIDAAVIILVVRHPASSWPYPVLATAGSVAGTLLTFWIGRKLDEAGLEQYVSSNKMASIKKSVRRRGTLAVAALGIVPPPFPFTAFVLAAGALGVDLVGFLVAFAAVRFLRFGLESMFAARYGSSVLRWLNSDVVVTVVSGVIVVAIVGSAISLYSLLRRQGPSRRKRSRSQVA
jgi:membrane protein YqaA with SNARE-associated domain